MAEEKNTERERKEEKRREVEGRENKRSVGQRRDVFLHHTERRVTI